MAFNLGAFAGGLAKGGMDTYSTLTDIEAKQQETKRREAEFGAWQKEQSGKEALRTAIAEQGGEKTFTPNFSGTGGMDSNDVAPTPVTQTPSQRLGGAMERAVQMGADPMAVMQYKKAARQDISDDAAQKAFDWMQASDKAVADKGLVAAAKEYLLPHYNSNKGTMNDGMTAEVVDSKAGPVVQFKDSKGNVQNNLTKPLNMKSFNEARDLVGSSMLAASGPDNWYKTKELGIKQGALDVEREYKGKGGVVERAHAAQTAAITGRSNKPTYKTVTVDGGLDASGNPVGKQPITIAISAGAGGNPVVQAYDLAGNKITDPKAIARAQMAAAQGEGGEGIPSQPVMAAGGDPHMLAAARKRYENGQSTYDDYVKDVTTIKTMGALPQPGGNLRPDAKKAGPTEVPQARAIAYTKGGFDKWTDAAASGTPADRALGREILQGWVNNNELSLGEKQQALKLLK